MYGKPPANKGVPHTEEAKAKMSAAQTGEKNSFYGKPSPRKGTHLSEETKAKLREKALARAVAKRAAKLAAAENSENQTTS